MTYPRKNRIDELAKFMEKNQDFNIICFQELITLKKIQQKLPNHKAIYSLHLGHIKGGLVTFISNKLSINSYEFRRFKDNFRNVLTIPDNIIKKGIQIIKLDNLTIINTHLVESYNKPAALKIQNLQLKEIYSFVPKEKSIICGDFNTTKSMQTEVFYDFQDSIIDELGCTICDENPNRKLTKKVKPLHEQYDNIFVSNDFRISNSKIHNEISNGETVVSDHFGISTSLSY